jgi:hypothetical protein
VLRIVAEADGVSVPDLLRSVAMRYMCRRMRDEICMKPACESSLSDDHGEECFTCPVRGWRAGAARGYSRDGMKGSDRGTALHCLTAEHERMFPELIAHLIGDEDVKGDSCT